MGRSDSDYSVYIDESYQLSRAYSNKPYYFLAGVGIKDAERANIRDELATVVDIGNWHATEGLRSISGRRDYVNLARWTAARFKGVVVADRAMHKSDRLGEATRAQLFRDLFVYFHGTKNLARVVYDRRMPGYQANSDARIFRDLRNKGLLSDTVHVRAATRHDDSLLLIPDLVASAFRQWHLGREESLWEPLVMRFDMVLPHSKPWLPQLHQGSDLPGPRVRDRRC